MSRFNFWRFVLPVLLLFLVSATHAQKINIEGSLQDSTGTSLPGATVMLLQAQDSVLSSFGITNNKGEFKLIGVPSGKYVLQTSFLGYEALNRPLEVKDGDAHKTLGALTMKVQSNNLAEMEVTADIVPMKLKKDTVEYNANAFKTEEHSAVEDLLKKLPGIEVEDDGTVKAQGEEVQKVLVDGKEFFGDDPKVATKNLPADAIDKVQVFDKKSEFAEFSGIDDGERVKTINLTLKEDRKKGYFGTVEAGYGTEERYRAKANINRFDKKKQMSILAMSNNVNEQGFSFDDYINFMGGIGALMGNRGSSGGRLTLNAANSPVPLNVGANDGFMTSTAGGFNFNREFGDRWDLRSSYFFNGINHDYTREAEREYILQGNFFRESQNDVVKNVNYNHRLNYKLTFEADSTQDFILAGNLSYNATDALTTNLSSTFNNEGIESNRSDLTYGSLGDQLNGNGSFTWRKRLKKKGRTFSLSTSMQYNDNVLDAGLLSYNSFFNDSINRSDTVNQDQDEKNLQLNYGASAIYTEPIGKRQFLRFDLSHQRNTNDYSKEFRDLFDGTRVFNDSLSTAFDRSYIYSKAGASFKVIRDKWNLTFGAAGQQATLNGTVVSDGQTLTKEFNNVLPSMQFYYDIAAGRRFNIFYETSTNEPSLDQLQPTIDNTDPLNIYVGNPDLNQEFTHTGTLGFMSFSQFSFTSIFANLRLSYTEDKITNATFTDSRFVQTTMPINVKQDLNATAYGSFSKPFRPVKTKLRINGNVNYNKGILFINNLEDETERWTTVGDVRLSNTNTDFIDLSVGLRYTYNINRYKLSSTLDQSYVNQSYYSTLDIYLNDFWKVGGEARYNIYEGGDAFGSDQVVFLLHGDISRSFLPGKKGLLKLSVHDALNQNQGINRTAQLNYIEEERISSLGRYFLMSFSYKITRIGKTRGKRGGDTETELDPEGE